MNIFNENGELSVTNLTRVPSKSKYYLKDIYFRESAYQIKHIFKSNIIDSLSKFSLVLIRPDALILQKAGEAVERIIQLGYDVVYYKPVKLNSMMVRELWRESYSQASIDRIHIHERMFNLVEAIAVIFYSPTSTSDWPASVNLSIQKGSTKEEKREANNLRAVLGSPSRFHSLIHVSDEPADVIRELGVLFSADERENIYSQLRQLPAASSVDNNSLLLKCRELEQLTAKYRCCNNAKNSNALDSRGFPSGCSVAGRLMEANNVQNTTLKELDQLLIQNHCVCSASCWVSSVLASKYISPYDHNALPGDYQKFIEYWVSKPVGSDER